MQKSATLVFGERWIVDSMNKQSRVFELGPERFFI